MGRIAGILQYLGPFGSGVILDLISEAGINVVNNTGVAIQKGALVYLSGVVAIAGPAGSQQSQEIILADGDVAGRGAMYVVTELAPAGKRVVVQAKAYLGGFNTAGRTRGDSVYLSTVAGGIIFVPVGNSQRVGRVGSVSATNGYIAFDIEAYALSALAEVATENTDVVIPYSTEGFAVVSGVWTRTRTSTATYRLRRNAGISVDTVVIDVPSVRLRSSTTKGLKVTGLRYKYTIATEVANDVVAGIFYTVVPPTGSAVAAALNFGGTTFDAAHDTAAKRGAIGEHTATITFSLPIYLPDGFLEATIQVDDSTGGGAVFDLWQVELLASETLVDAS